MLRKTALMTLVVALSLVVAVPVFAGGGPPPRDEDGNRVRVVVYVESQGLFYDSIVGPALPPHGPFQKLEPSDVHDGPKTMYGPGDPEYVGGRWWVDNGDIPGEMDDADTYFSCPLLGTGRATP